MKKRIWGIVGIIVLVMVGMGGLILELQGQYVNLSADYGELNTDYVNLSADYVNLSADYGELNTDYKNLTKKVAYLEGCVENRKQLLEFLENDQIDEREYSISTYYCANFREDLVKNLREAGFDARKFTAKNYGTTGHAMVFVYFNDSENGNVLIEPQTDKIWLKGDGSEASDYLYNLLGYHPEIMKISKADGTWE